MGWTRGTGEAIKESAVLVYYAGECRNRAELLRVEAEFRELVAPPPWWWFGFDGKALLEAVVGTVVGLIALFSSYDHVNFLHGQLPLPQQWGVWLIALSLPLVLRMLNWRRDPVVEMQIERSEQRAKQLRSETEQLKKERKQIEKEIALLDWIHSELDLIEADLPSSSTPPQATAANSSDC